MNKGKIIFLIPILLLGSIFAPALIHTTHAAVTGEICLNDPTTANGSSTPCPTTPAIFDGPRAQQIRIGVFIQGSDALNGFDIILVANHTVVSPMAVDLTGTVLPGTPTVVLECVQGLLKTGSVCGLQDTVDTLHFTVTAGLGLLTTPPTTGLLFTAIYNITGTAPAAGISIGYQTGCTSTSVTGGVCVTVANGSTSPVSETAQAGRFNNSTPPALVAISAAPTSFGPEFPTTTNTATVTATAMGGYPGFATDSVSFTTSTTTGLTATLTGTNPCLTGGLSCSVTLSLSALAAGTYFATVTGTYATVDSLNNPDTLSGLVTLKVVVNDFGFTVNPTTISFNSGSTGTATISLSSLNNFAGTIGLSTGTVIPTTAPLTVSYSPASVTLAAGGTAISTATFSASPTTITTYHALIKATSGTRIKASPTLTIQVSTAATPDFALGASPNSLSILPSATGASTLTVAPLNGFTGTVNLATTVSPSTGPTVSLSSATIAGGSGNSTLTVLTQSSTPSGTYIVMVTGTSGAVSHTVAITVIVAGSGTGVVCIVSSGTTSCPSSPTVFSGTRGTQLRVSVFIQGSNSINGFDITLLTDHNVLRPAGINLTGTVLPTPTTILSECVGSVTIQGSSCPANADTLELAAVGAPSQLTFPPTTGLLFTAIYNITGTTSGIPLGYQIGCSMSSVSGTTTCVTVANGSTSSVQETVQTAIFSTNTTPDFVMTTSPASLNIHPGSSATSATSISSANNFTGTVTLSSTVSPSGPAVTFSTSSLAVPSGGSVTTIITITTTNSTLPGLYVVTVSGTSGAISHSVALSVNVVSRVASSLAIDGSATGFCAHDTNSCAATLTTQHSNDIIIVYTIEALDLQTSCAFNVSDTSGLSWTARSNVVFGGNNRDQIQEFWAKSTGTLSSDVITETIIGCASVQYGGEYNGLMAFGITGANFNSPFDPNASLPNTASGLSTDASAFVSTSNPGDMVIGGIWHGAAPLTPGTGFTFITSSPGAPMAAEYEMVNAPVTNFAVGFGDPLSADWVMVGDAVQPASITPDFSLSASPSSLTLIAGSSATSSITTTSLNAFSGTVTLSATTPSGLTGSLNPMTLILSSNSSTASRLTVTSTSSILAGSYTITITGTSGSLTHSISVRVTVTQPDFTISASPTFISTRAGSNATVLITLASLNGFSGYVNLTATILTSGISPPIPHMTPSIFFLSAGGSQTFALLLTTSTTTSVQTYTLSVVGAANAGSTFVFHRSLVQLQILSPPDIPPVANFSITPTNPVVGQNVAFDGSTSSDPDGFVVSWSWAFGDGSFSCCQFTSHTYNRPGNYTVTLTVTDNAGLSASKSTTVDVRPPPAHDVSIFQVNASPTTAVSTQTVFINFQLANNGLNNETVSVTAFANGRPVQTQTGIFLQSCLPQGFFCGFRYFTIAWDTSGITPGNYSTTVTVFLAPREVDPTPADNTMSAGTVTILPPPVIKLTPNIGPDGTKVTVQGTGFPIFEQFGYGYPSVVYIEVNYDNMSSGFTLSRNGTFTFTLDVPLSQVGPHGVFAYDPYSGAHASAIFTVTATNNNNLAVSIDMGTIYFPGDTATAYILTTLNGTPIGQGVQLQITVFRPDGTNTTLTAIMMGTGLYKATYTIPSTGLLGTYLVVARAHQSGPLDASSLVSFEVKLSWLSSNNGKITVGATTLAGVVGLAGLAWKKGYLRRKENEDQPFVSGL